jgi:hypothetical protein
LYPCASEALGFTFVKKTDTIFIALMEEKSSCSQSRNFGMAQGDWSVQQDAACEKKVV